jgi:threonine/homoserine/homoserine lactone efflux protein
MTALFVLALVFQADPGIFWSPKVLGGVYIAQLGWRMWRDAATPPDKRPSCRLPRGAASTLRLGAKTQLATLALTVLFSAILIGTVPPNTPLSVYVALLAVVFLNEMLRNVIVARIFSFDSTRRGYISLKTVLDRAFGGLLAIIGVKIAAT